MPDTPPSSTAHRNDTDANPVRREVPSRDASHDPDANPDPVTGSPGSHPLGTGIGAASGAATGAAMGAIGGPIGAVIGGVSGAVVGGLIGHGIGEAVDPTEDEYWRENYETRGYRRDDATYDDYEPAYRLGYNAADTAKGPYSDEYDTQLEEEYGKRRGESRLEYDEAKPAIRDAFDRRSEKYADSNA